MKLRFEVFTVVVWQPALPEKSVKVEFSGNVIQTYITGKRFPDEWFFRADFDHESHNNLADGREINWRPETSSDPSSIVTESLTGAPPKKDDKGFVRSKLLGDYAGYNDNFTVGGYVDLETVKQNSDDPLNIAPFLWRKPGIRTLLVEMDDRSFFREIKPSDLKVFNSMKLEIHFVKRFRGVAYDGGEAE